MADSLHIPFVEILKSIPGIFGIRLEPEPAYQVVERLGDVEVRRYAPALLAEVTVDGPHEAAVNEGFERLARYIFGGNAGGVRSAMTVPVVQRQGETLPMTTPVVQRPGDGAWTISFFLSNDLAPEQAPQPTDPSIRLVRSPERLTATLRYRGTNTDEQRHDARRELLAALEHQSHYRVVSEVVWAQYDGPFVLPFVRRNEAQVEVSPAS